MNDKQAIQQVIAKDEEVYENLKAFYGGDVLEVLGEAANVYNAARLAHMTGRPDLSKHLKGIASHLLAPVARMAKKEAKDVVRDMMALANARVATVRP